LWSSHARASTPAPSPRQKGVTTRRYVPQLYRHLAVCDVAVVQGEPGGRLIVSSYTNAGQLPRPMFEHLATAGHPPDGIIHIDRSGGGPLMTAWINV
jgi:hypothetical protein